MCSYSGHGRTADRFACNNSSAMLHFDAGSWTFLPRARQGVGEGTETNGWKLRPQLPFHIHSTQGNTILFQFQILFLTWKRARCSRIATTENVIILTWNRCRPVQYKGCVTQDKDWKHYSTSATYSCVTSTKYSCVALMFCHITSQPILYNESKYVGLK